MISARRRSAPLSTLDRSPIEDIRIIAILMVVTYHVIGLPDSGLQFGAPHPLRLFADLLNLLMMPIFAMIAGLVYAARPPDLRGFGAFMVRKLRRLAIPGLVAALVFAAIATVMHLRWAVAPDALWRLAVYPYAHFWFVQSILTLFLVVGFADAVTSHRAALPLLAAAILLAHADIALPAFFSLPSTIGLAPYFIIGICLRRQAGWLEARRVMVLSIAGACVLFWSGAALIDHARTGGMEIDYSHWRPMLFVVGVFLLLLFLLPPHPAARPIGRMTYTIYLYHVLGTAGMRVLLNRLGITAIPIHLIAGVTAGLCLPVALHLLAARWPLTAEIILGIRRRAATGARGTPPI